MNLFSGLLAMAEKIPAAFWGVVIGAFFSLGGVALTNRANDRRLRVQLAHDRDLRNRERELSLRKDIYLAAAEAVSAGLVAVGRFANLEIAFDKLTEEYVGKSPSIAKVHVIAREDTARAVATLTGELGATYMRLSAKRIPLIAQKQHLAFLAEQMAGFSRERDRMLELMKQYNLEGAADARRWGVIEKNFEFEQQRIAEITEQHSNLAKTIYLQQIEYAQECIGEVTRLSRLQLPALVAVRRELELPIDEAAYRKIIEDGIAKQEARMSEFFADVQRLGAAQLGAPGGTPRTARP